MSSIWPSNGQQVFLGCVVRLKGVLNKLQDGLHQLQKMCSGIDHKTNSQVATCSGVSSAQPGGVVSALALQLCLELEAVMTG